MAEALLRLEGLRKKFGALVVTDDLTFDVMPNELHAIIGPNGAGKTTLINQISGLTTPDAGAFCLPAATSRPCRCTRAQDWAWRERSRSVPSFPDSRRSRTSRSRCRRAPARASVSSATPRWSRH